MAPRPPDDSAYSSRYRRYWGYTNRPFTGCGCFYVVLALLALWFVLSLFMPALAIWGGF